MMLESCKIFINHSIETMKSAKDKLPFDLQDFVPDLIGKIKDHQKDLPLIAKDPKATAAFKNKLGEIPTFHDLYLGDARDLNLLEPGSIRLVLTSQPYWTLKKYRETEGHMGHVKNYEIFLAELE
jgi:modification methylase